MLDPKDLDRLEKDELIRFLLHHLTGDLRRQIMRRYPQTYNKLCGGSFVLTVMHPGSEADAHNEAIPPHAI